MKSTGIVRKVDELGRIVLPVEMRRKLDVAVRDEMEIYAEGDKIVLTKYSPACIFCNGTKSVTEYCGKKVCIDCINKLSSVK